MTTPASPNQRLYIASLAIDLGIRHDLDGLTMAQASETIDRLRAELDRLTVEGFRKRGVAID